MNWILESENLKAKRPSRTYTNKATGSVCTTELLYTDKDGQQWYGFKDLFTIPYIRIAMAKHISDLFTIGLALKDIIDWCKREKDLINGNDPEKLQKLYALILQKEAIATQTADPIKQHLSLCTVYVLRADERIDHFTEQMAAEKLTYWSADVDMTAFFLTWHNRHMANSMKALNRTSEIVSIVRELQETSQQQQPGL